jgi:uncharacterized SAM-binding protein YcdF (DUF218 family)
MKPTSYIKRKYIIIISVLGLMLLLMYVFVVAGNWLVVKNELIKADAIVVLMGSPGDRILEAKDIYSNSYSSKIFFIEDNDPGRKELKAKGIILPNDAIKNKATALQLGIPDSVITIVPGNANSTYDEAKVLLTYLNKNQEIESIIIISSNYHMRRAGIIFNNELAKCNHKVEIILAPSKYTEFNANHWYSDRQSRKIVVFEYIKILNYYLFD